MASNNRCSSSIEGKRRLSINRRLEKLAEVAPIRLAEWLEFRRSQEARGNAGAGSEASTGA
jgi:hypothetical protein